MSTDVCRSGHDRRHGDRLVRLDAARDNGQLGEGRCIDAFDEDIENAAARQSDGECIVIADAVALQRRRGSASTS